MFRTVPQTENTICRWKGQHGEWTSNNEELLQHIKNAENTQNVTTSSQNTEIGELCEDDESFAKSTCNAICSEDEVKVLGIAWDRKNDKFKFNFSNFAQTAASSELVTKQIILSMTARFYDPLGLLSPVIVPLKEIFQEVCELKIDWDDELPTEISNEWHKLINDIANNSSIEFQTLLLGDIEVKHIKSIQLHRFSDASQKACVYLRIETTSKVEICLICSKTRIAPLKGKTIPQLELMAALILAQLITSVNEALKPCIEIESTFCWTDAQVALHWILGEKKEPKQVFVGNRVRQINGLVNKTCWGYCPTKSNPANLASRGIECSKIANNKLW